MMGKKQVGFYSALIGLFSISFVSALDIRRISESMVDAYVQFFEPVLRALFGGQDWSGNLLFEKLLFFIIFFALVYIALMTIPLFKAKKGIVIVITIAVSLLGTRFVNTEWLMAVIMQYKVLAIVLTAILPFVIYFFFLKGIFPGPENAFMRKLGWALFAIVYAGLWATVPDEVQAEIFFWTMVASFIFIFLDGYVERYLEKRKFHETRRRGIHKRIAELDRDISYYRSLPYTDPEEKKRIVKELEEERESLLKEA